MKKTIVLILLLIPMLCFAGALQEKHRSVIAKKNVPAAGGYSYTAESWASTTWNSSYTGSTITLGSHTYKSLGFAASSYGEATKCYIALYSSNGSSRLAYGECSPRTANEWCEATIDYEATAGTHQIWVGCNSTVSKYYNAAGCTAYWADYADPPPASIAQNADGNNCWRLRAGY